MNIVKFRTLRHIETVRNYINGVISELLKRGELHDQSKLQSPEVEVFQKFTPKLKSVEFGSEQYKKCMGKMKPAIDHHNANNPHHPEYHQNGIKDMTLIDLIEMICDWKCATLRTKNANIMKSIEINQKRFKYSNELKQIFINTIKEIEKMDIKYYGEES